MAITAPRPAALAAPLEAPVEEWPYLEGDVLAKNRSHKVCMTCHWFRHHAAANCIPLLTCQLHQGLITHGEHLTSRCHGWTDDMLRQKGWAPEASRPCAVHPPSVSGGRRALMVRGDVREEELPKAPTSGQKP